MSDFENLTNVYVNVSSSIDWI